MTRRRRTTATPLPDLYPGYSEAFRLSARRTLTPGTWVKVRHPTSGTFEARFRFAHEAPSGTVLAVYEMDGRKVARCRMIRPQHVRRILRGRDE